MQVSLLELSTSTPSALGASIVPLLGLKINECRRVTFSENWKWTVHAGEFEMVMFEMVMSLDPMMCLQTTSTQLKGQTWNNMIETISAASQKVRWRD